MAWLSVGETNDDLCDKLLEHGVLQHGSILNAFRNTDRGDFVQQDNRWDKEQPKYYWQPSASIRTWTAIQSSSFLVSFLLLSVMHRSLAYADRPFRHEHVHISAPHMYATVLEQLELSEGLSFLNIGESYGHMIEFSLSFILQRSSSMGWHIINHLYETLYYIISYFTIPCHTISYHTVSKRIVAYNVIPYHL